MKFMALVAKIRSIIPKRGVDAILGDFKRTLNDLAALTAAHDAQVKANDETIQKLFTKNGDLLSEVRRANRVRENIERLIEE